MASLDNETFAGLKTLYDANSTLEGLTLGGFVRHDERPGNIHNNRIEYRMVADNDESGSGVTIRRCTVHLTARVTIQHAHGAGDTPEASGDIEKIEREMETTFGGVLISGTDWGFSLTSHPRWLSNTVGPENIVSKTMALTFLGAKS